MPARWDGWTTASTARNPRRDLHEHVLERGSGCEVWDVDGRCHLDGVAGAANTPFGHAHPRVTEAVAAHLRQLVHVDETLAAQRPAEELIDALAELTGMDDFVFVNSGSEAVEASIRIAMDYWRHRGQPERDTIIAFARGYHGCTALTAGLSGLPILHTDWATKPHVQHVELASHHHPDQPDAARALAAAFDAAITDAGPQRVAAVIVEPFLNVGGGIVLPDGFLTELRTVTSDHDCLMIVDEVFTGFGRSGRAFAIEEMPEPPDILAISKGMTNGVVPMGATCLRRGIREHFGDEPLRYGHTTSGHGLGCVAALATIDLLRIDGLTQAAATAESLATKWLATEWRYLRAAGVVDLRTYGVVGVAQCDTVERARAIAARARREGVSSGGLIIGCKGPALMLTPALNVPERQLVTMVARLKFAIAEVEIDGGSVLA
ncbi:aminotransferase class III-fold pyridoxal phosphate-dependent enzyme [Nocardia pseudovaccinii]|uniref:aminotransferase class III-fold pyridoxal phosphate-dependent enzyme n=1 Tax=Nocardia pseudovaccinii TaxID=189540 RepID=UPI0007A47D50|nr:aspartate aminotransferase family protein [Nocardia pseudovaccinii]